VAFHPKASNAIVGLAMWVRGLPLTDSQTSDLSILNSAALTTGREFY
jgi:hypothetical protein